MGPGAFDIQVKVAIAASGIQTSSIQMNGMIAH